MKEILKWNFVSTGGGDADGLNNSMIEHFTGNYNYFLAREINQNSLDAKNRSIASPVKVSFRLEYFIKEEFPGHDDLVEIIKYAKDYWKENKQTVDFLNNAEECLKNKKIPFLRVSDYYTIGLSGSDKDKGGGWFNLVRSTGASVKKSGEGGSFGIGKGAPFAASDLRIVFYSTKNSEGQFVFQGKAELVSFEKDGDEKRGVGSFGINQNSIRDISLIPERFRRDEEGTDIIIAGYKITTDWKEDLLKSVLRNFWYAIHCNDLEVEVEQIFVNTHNLSEYLVRYFANEPFKDYVEPTGNPLQYYLAVIQGEELGKGRLLKHLGECKFYFNSIEAHMNYVAMLRRSHMVIYSRRFNFPGNFAGVFICDNDKGNDELRKMEPPAHDKWDPKRHKEQGESIMNELTSFIRSCLDAMKRNQTFGVLEIPELQRFLPYDEEGNNTGNGNNGSESSRKEAAEETSRVLQKIEEFEVNAIINPYRVSVINEDSNSSAGIIYPSDSDGPSGNGPGGGGEDLGKNKGKKIKDLSVRTFLIKENGNRLSYRLILRSDKDKKCNLYITAVGEEGSEKLNILDFRGETQRSFTFFENKVQHIEITKGARNQFEIEIESPIKISLKVDAYDLQ